MNTEKLLSWLVVGILLGLLVGVIIIGKDSEEVAKEVHPAVRTVVAEDDHSITYRIQYMELSDNRWVPRDSFTTVSKRD